MKRLLQVGTLLFVLATFLAPVAECFDRWDAPGLMHDTEFAVFALVLVLCLVLLVSSIVAAAAAVIGRMTSLVKRADEPPVAACDRAGAAILHIPPLLLIPLRI